MPHLLRPSQGLDLQGSGSELAMAGNVRLTDINIQLSPEITSICFRNIQAIQRRYRPVLPGDACAERRRSMGIGLRAAVAEDFLAVTDP